MVPQPQLRITPLHSATGATHMAADSRMLELTARDGNAHLRLYTWDPPAVSLGCTQKVQGILDVEALQRDGVEWVLRPTGGRPVLHAQDLTYSIAFPADSDVFGKSIRESYRVVAQCLKTGLALAGIACDTHDSDLDAALVRREGKLPCFLAPNREEIMAGGRKLMGSAQKRTNTSVLQHGSIPIGPTFRELPKYLRLSPDVRERYEESLRSKCICVSEIDHGVTLERLAECVAAGFVEELGDRR